MLEIAIHSKVCLYFFMCRQTSNSLGPDKDSPTISTKTTKKKHTLDNNVNSHHLKAELYHQRFSKKLDVRSSPAPRPRNSKLESDGNPSSNRQLWYVTFYIHSNIQYIISQLYSF